MHIDWLKIVFLQLDKNTELAQAIEAMMENLHFDDQSKKVVSLFCHGVFLKK